MPSHFNYCLIIYYPCLDQISKYDHISTKINELKWLHVENIFQYHLSVCAFKMFLRLLNPHILDENLNLAEALMTLNFDLFITCQCQNIILQFSEDHLRITSADYSTP
jgi:hypothetical protein